MTTIQDLTVSKLRRVVALKEQIEELQRELDSIISTSEVLAPVVRRKRRMSAAACARIGAAARARWAKYRRVRRARPVPPPPPHA